MPEKLITIDNKIIGFMMPYIDNINFQDVLDSNEFTIKDKIIYFKQIGKLLEKMQKIRLNTKIKDFYLNDLHENNFILNKKTNYINVVDLDSCKINDNLSFGSRYLSPISVINKVSKYIPITEGISIGGSFKPSSNTDLFCYIVMILNYISGIKITNLNIEEYYEYLEYLHKIGISFELINKLNLIYKNDNNENPYYLLDELVFFIEKCSYTKFNDTKRKYIRCKK